MTAEEFAKASGKSVAEVEKEIEKQLIIRLKVV